jgi:uroporphyrinogen III methyltransferase/synthase
VVFVTGHEDPTKGKSAIDWKSIARCGTIVLYMAVENIAQIADRLLKAGKPGDTPVVAVSHAGGILQKTAKATLETLPEVVEKEDITPPVVFIIGEVAALEKRFNWFRKNRRTLFTGLSDERAFIKGTYLHLPLIRIEPMPDYSAFDQYIENIREFDWIVFTSRYGVEYFFRRLKHLGHDARTLSNIHIAAIGNSTRRHLEKHGVLADLVPEDESSEGLLKELKKIDLKDKKVFLPRSDISDKGLTEGIKKLQARVISCDAYRNVMPTDLPDIDIESFDEVMFTSPSGVRNFLKRYGRLPKKVKARFIGKVTQNEALQCHITG